MTFTTSFDDIVRKKTISVCIMFTVLPFSHILIWKVVSLWNILMTAILILILLLSYLKRAIKYKVDHNNILIYRLLGNVVINIQDKDRVDRIHHDFIVNSTSGRVFGYSGKYYADSGNITFYATRRNNLIMLTKKDKTKIILTPDQEDEFIIDLEKGINAQH
jgi:hypothetical protein